MKDSYEQRIQNQFGAFCVKVLKNEARHIQREYARLRDQEKSLGELTASELEQTAVWDKHFMDEYVFDVQGLPVVVNGNILADALAQLPESKRDVILLSYFLGMTDREISEKLNIVHQTVSKRRRATWVQLCFKARHPEYGKPTGAVFESLRSPPYRGNTRPNALLLFGR